MSGGIARIVLAGGIAAWIAEAGGGAIEIHATQEEIEAAGGPDELVATVAAGEGVAEHCTTIRVVVEDGGEPPGIPDPGWARAWKGAGGPPTVVPDGAAGALSGMVVALSPGHGAYWNEDRGTWTTQRGEHFGMIEDLWTARFVTFELAPLLEAAGATVIVLRQEASPEWEVAAGGVPVACTATPACPCSLRFDLAVPEGDVVPVLALASGMRTTWTLSQGGWEREIGVGPIAMVGAWTRIGRYGIDGGSALVATIATPPGESGSITIAGIRAGGGIGDVDAGGGPSGLPRWQEAARYWVETLGAPEETWAVGGDEDAKDRRCRGRYAALAGSNVFLSVHTNGGEGTGTVTFVHDSATPEGSEDLQAAIQAAVVEAIRAEWDPEWKDRGAKRSDLDELADARPMPSVLVEIAFHDSEWDAWLLGQPMFRRTVARAMVRAMSWWADPWALPQPPAPIIVRAVNLGGGSLRIEWRPGNDPMVPADPSWAYTLHAGSGTRVVDGGVDLGPCCSAEIPGFTQGEAVTIRIVARSTGGAGPASAAAAVVVGDSPAPVLLVDGYSRLDDVVDESVNTGDSAFDHALAIRDARSGLVAADFASSAAAPSVLASGAYRALDWWTGLGPEAGYSIAPDASIAIAAFVDSGGAAVVSGSGLSAALVAAGGSPASLASGTFGAWSDGSRCEGPITLPGSPGTTLAAGSGVISPLGAALPVAVCEDGGAAGVIVPPGADRGGSALLDFAVESAGTAADRAALLSILLDDLGIFAPAPPIDDAGAEDDAGDDAGEGPPDPDPFPPGEWDPGNGCSCLAAR